MANLLDLQGAEHAETVQQDETGVRVEQPERPVQDELRDEHRLLRHHEGGQHDQEQPSARRKIHLREPVRRQCGYRHGEKRLRKCLAARCRITTQSHLGDPISSIMKKSANVIRRLKTASIVALFSRTIWAHFAIISSRWPYPSTKKARTDDSKHFQKP